jgi:hypothetical protein
LKTSRDSHAEFNLHNNDLRISKDIKSITESISDNSLTPGNLARHVNQEILRESLTLDG